jgi:hypothetical protein
MSDKPTAVELKKRIGRPPTGWVKVGVKLSPEAAALLATVPPLMKSATVDEALRVYFALTSEVAGLDIRKKAASNE